MTRWVPQKKDVLASLTEEYLHNYGRGRTILAVDGADSVATAAFADDLATAMRAGGTAVFRASLGGFLRPRSERSVIRDSLGADTGVTDPAELAYRAAYDYGAFRRVLVDPFRMGGSTGFVPAFFDAQRDAPVEPTWLTGPADAVLLSTASSRTVPSCAASGTTRSTWTTRTSTCAVRRRSTGRSPRRALPRSRSSTTPSRRPRAAASPTAAESGCRVV
jgi:hypothetical protein